MNIYSILRRVTSVRSPRLRLAMLYGAHAARRRCIGIYLDPVLACNLRCRMCAFSDARQRSALRGRMADADLRSVADGLMPRALKVQIGCAAEPTLDGRVAGIIAMAKAKGVPYVSVTTNGQLLTADLLQSYVDAGLDELTLSLHGVRGETYEWLMQGADFQRFQATIAAIRQVKSGAPKFKLRVNYTVNADNVEQLDGLLDLFGPGVLDILQLRPVQCLGETAYTNFDLGPVEAAYDAVIAPLAERCRREGIDCLVPSKSDLRAVDTTRSWRDALFESVTYCYVGPGTCYGGNYDVAADDYASFHRRNHTARRLIGAALGWRKGERMSKQVTKKLNYRVRRGR